jgi:hypothetical protein
MHVDESATQGRRRSVSGSRPCAPAMHVDESATQGSRRSVSGSIASGSRPSGSRTAGSLISRIFRRKER